MAQPAVAACSISTLRDRPAAENGAINSVIPFEMGIWFDASVGPER
jgi:hypothetical protein